MKFDLFRLGFIALGFSAALATPAFAQNGPAGALFDLAAVRTTPLTSYTAFSYGFVADQSTTTVSFAFRDTPAYFAFDNVSVVKQGSTTNLLADPGFESATVGQQTPTGWGRFIQPIDTSAIGRVASVSSSSGCINAAAEGTKFWCDGSVQGYDGLYQTLATTVDAPYTVSFDLQENSGRAPIGLIGNNNAANNQVNMLGYAGNTLPGGTVSVVAPIAAVPEPDTCATLLAGLGLMGFMVRRRKTS